MFNRFREEVKEIEKEANEPVTIESIKNLIEIIEVAHKINCHFDLTLTLSIGDFCIDSDAYTGIKLLSKNKTDDDRLVISYKNVLLSNDTVIAVTNIVGIDLHIEYGDKSDN